MTWTQNKPLKVQSHHIFQQSKQIIVEPDISGVMTNSSIVCAGRHELYILVWEISSLNKGTDFRPAHITLTHKSA